MNEQQEYINFWMSILKRLEETQIEYKNLSAVNKQRADRVGNAVLHARSYVDAIQIMRAQTK